MLLAERCTETEQWVMDELCTGAQPVCAQGVCAATTANCLTWLESGATMSGAYIRDVDGEGPDPAFTAHCDLSHDGGGWTLVRASAGAGTSSSVEGDPATEANRHVSTLRWLALAGTSSQVHIRTAGNPGDSITSVPGSSPILRFRQGLSMVDPGPSCNENPVADWTTPPGSTRLNAFRFSCCPQVGAYPDGVFHACNFSGGMHWLSTYSSWTGGGSTQLELYCR